MTEHEHEHDHAEGFGLMEVVDRQLGGRLDTEAAAGLAVLRSQLASGVEESEAFANAVRFVLGAFADGEGI